MSVCAQVTNQREFGPYNIRQPGTTCLELEEGCSKILRVGAVQLLHSVVLRAKVDQTRLDGLAQPVEAPLLETATINILKQRSLTSGSTEASGTVQSIAFSCPESVIEAPAEEDCAREEPRKFREKSTKEERGEEEGNGSRFV